MKRQLLLIRDRIISLVSFVQVSRSKDRALAIGTGWPVKISWARLILACSLLILAVLPGRFGLVQGLGRW